MKRKILSTIVALLLVVALLPMSVLAASYTDTDGHWAEKSIDRWSAAGIVQGTGDAFAPDSDLTCAQLATILAKLLRLPAADDAGFSDNLADAWYYDAINRCAAAGILNGYADGTVRPNETISRARAMVMLARALGIEAAGTSVLNGYADAANVPDWARGYVAALLRADIVSGVSGSRLAALANITRAQFVTILDRAIAVYADEDGATVKADDVDGIIVVVAEDVQIKDAPAGTKVVAAASAKSLKVNGKSVDANDIHIVPETAERPKSVGHAHTHEYKYTDNGDGTHTGTCTANDSTLEPAPHEFDENSKCTICGAVQPETSVASVKAADGTVTYFETLADAVANAADGATIALLDGQELSANLKIGTQVTLDLNGKTLETKGYATQVQGSGDLTVTGNGTVNNDQEPVMVGKNKNYRTLFFVEGGEARLTIENGTFTTKSSQAIFAEGTVTIHDGTFQNTAESVNDVLDSSAMITAVGSAANMTIHKASIFATAESENAGIYGIYGANGAHITLEDGVEVATSFAAIGMNNTTSDPEVVITVNGGTYRSECQQLDDAKYSKFNAVCYLPGKCQMTINGGTFIAGNEKMHIFSVPYAQAGMNLTITDGVFKAGSNVFYSKNDNHSNQTTDNKIAVSGGSFTGTIAAFHENNTFSAFITGGTFSTDPTAYLAAGYKAAEKEGSWTVEEMAWDDYPADGTVMPAGVVITSQNIENRGDVTVSLADEEAFKYFTQVFDMEAACAARAEALANGTATRYPGESAHPPLNIWYSAYHQVHVELNCDVDLGDMDVTPFTEYHTFDGKGHTISNANVTGEDTCVGFFGGNALTNVTLDNIHVTASGSQYAGVACGYSSSSVTNVTVTNSTVTGGRFTGGVLGNCYVDLSGCTVQNCVISGQYKVGGLAGYVCRESGNELTFSNNTLIDVTVKGENLISGKSDYVIGQAIGNWNARSGGSVNNTTVTRVTGAEYLIGKIESDVETPAITGSGIAM